MAVGFFPQTSAVPPVSRKRWRCKSAYKKPNLGLTREKQPKSVSLLLLTSKLIKRVDPNPNPRPERSRPFRGNASAASRPNKRANT